MFADCYFSFLLFFSFSIILWMSKIQHLARIYYSVASILLFAPIVKYFLSKTHLPFEKYDEEYIQVHINLWYKQYVFVIWLFCFRCIGFYFQNIFFTFVAKIGTILWSLMTMVYIVVVFTYDDVKVLSCFYNFSFSHFLRVKIKKVFVYVLKRLHKYIFSNIRY